MSNQIDTKVLDGIMQAHDYNPAQVIAIMQDSQKEYRYLPEAALSYIASGLKISEAKVYGVATFYEKLLLIFIILFAFHFVTVDSVNLEHTH